MDGAADRVNLRGLQLLGRSRTLRCEAARREVARALEQVEAAEAGAWEAEARLSGHCAAWRAQEAETLAAMAGGNIDGRRFRDRGDALDRMADRAILLRRRLDEACAQANRARTELVAARALLARQQRRLQQSDAVITHVTGLREAAAVMQEEQALDDDLALRRVPASGARAGLSAGSSG